MARRSKWAAAAAGLAAGLALGALLRLCAPPPGPCAAAPDPAALVRLRPDETVDNSDRTLLFVGVMTAQRYLETRARAVHDTWARELPGRAAFFSSAGSVAAGLPLVALPAVDDRYPPQKKSFMMLLYMHEHYGERFEWFMRADDDVYVRADRLAAFLRSVDSRRPLFVGQAGRGTRDEDLSLGREENFCMGGPGVLLSRETLRRVAPHVRYCLKHLVTEHEDVELGRCVAKFAGVSCTWSYDMQTILHHNGSGAAAYTGSLKAAEVHRAITLHPVKDYRQMYRIHAYFKNLQIQETRDHDLDLHRELATSLRRLGVSPAAAGDYRLPGGEALFPDKLGEEGYLGDTAVLGAPVDMDRYHPETLEDIIPFEFFTKSVYSLHHGNPKRSFEAPLKEALDDVIREVMDIINAPSRERGRVILFSDLLYGYTRLNPIHGYEHVLDMKLVYMRYRGRKLTANVRRHAYLVQSFTANVFRELRPGEAPAADEQPASDRGEDYAAADDAGLLDRLGVRGALHTGLSRIHSLSLLPWSPDLPYPTYDRRINVILPLSGRHETFARFMRNYEDIVLRTDETVTLIVVLYANAKNAQDYIKTTALISQYAEKYTHKEIKVIKMGSTNFSRGAALTAGIDSLAPEELAFLLDVDIMFNSISLRRVRMNTVRYYQVYFPVVFSEYNPEVVTGEDFNRLKGDNTSVNLNKDLGRYDIDLDGIEEPDRDMIDLKYTKRIDDDLGYFRSFGFGILSIHKCDFDRVSGFNLTIKGWGMEDVQLFETLIKTNLSVFRIEDETLVHIYHSVDCDASLGESQYNMCLGTKATTYGNKKHMTYYILNHPEIMWPQENVKEEKGPS